MDLNEVMDWHKSNPPDQWEIMLARLIAERTGLRNEWILGKE